MAASSLTCSAVRTIWRCRYQLSGLCQRSALWIAESRLTFPVLSDVGNLVAKGFGIVFTLPMAWIHANKTIGRDLMEINGEAGAAQLPIPATFVLDKSGVIRLAFVEEDWSKRL